MNFDARALLRPYRRLDAPGFSVALGLGGARLGGFHPPLLQAERIPPQPQPAPSDRQQDDRHPDQRQPPQRRQRPHQIARPHG